MRLVPFDGSPKECRVRTEADQGTLRKGCKFIRDIGKKIGFPNITILTAQFYFRKFYQSHSLESMPFLDIALTAVILASKVEDTFERIKNVLVAAFLILNGDSFKGRPEDIIITEEHRNRVIQYERDLLISIGFQFCLTHPHCLLIRMAHSIKLSFKTAQQAQLLLDELYESDDLVLAEPPHALALSALLQCCDGGSEKSSIESWCHANSLHFCEIKQRPQASKT